MFKSAESRFGLRAAVATVLGFLGALQVAAPDGISGTEWITVATATITVLAGYLTAGAVSGSVEPFVGRKLEPPPVPPAGDQR